MVKNFQDIPKNLQDKFENATIRIIEIRKESHPDVKFEIFERLNTGAVQLNAQELRNCIYQGIYNALLNELSEDKDFQFLLGIKGLHSRMQDRELILRFFAFYHNTHLKYTPSIYTFALFTEPLNFTGKMPVLPNWWNRLPACYFQETAKV